MAIDESIFSDVDDDMPVERTFTLGEIAEALKKNGYKWTQNSMWDGEGFCATAQVALNLGFVHDDDGIDGKFEQNAWAIHRALRNIYLIDIVNINDRHAARYQDVVDHILPKLEKRGLENTITVEVYE